MSKKKKLASPQKGLHKEIQGWKKHWVATLILGIVAFLLYANTLGHDYALDDYSVLKDNYVTQQGVEGISTIFTTHYRYGYWNSQGELYRPFTLSIFALAWELSPDNPSFYHFLNVLFYALTGMLLFLTLTKVFHQYSWIYAFLISLLFIVHPVHVEVVANIKSLDEILAFLFCLLSLNLLWKHWQVGTYQWLILALGTYSLAMFSKENAITFLLIFPLVGWFFLKGFNLKKAAFTSLFLLPIGIYLLVRRTVLGTISSAKDTSVLDNVIAAADSFGIQFSTALLFVGKYIQSLFFPHPLSHEYGFNQIPLTDFSDWRVWLVLIIILASLFYALKACFSDKNPIAFGLLFFTINFSIFSNILLMIGTNYGDRLLYVSSLGFVIGFIFLLKRFLGYNKLTNNDIGFIDFLKKNQILLIVFSTIIVLFSVKTITRNVVWKNSLSLYEADIQTAPNSAKLNYHYGLELSKKADKANTIQDKKRYYELGMKHLQKAIEIFPTYHDAFSRIGLTYYYSKDYENALKNYKLSIQYKPNNATVLSNMGTLYFEQNKLAEAKAVYEKAVGIDPRFVDGWRNLGSINGIMKKFPEAIRCFAEGLKYEPNNATLNYYLGSAYLDAGQMQKGRPYLDKAYQLDPSLPKK